MRKTPNKLWALGPPLSILLLAFAYYVKVASFRNWVDGRAPWVKDYLGRFVSEPEVIDVPAPPKPAMAEKRSQKSPIQAQTPARTPEPPTLEAFAANPALWPKTVKLHTPTDFPAVVNGKKVGTLQAPAGTEANLVKVKGQLLGVEYKGGGAWVAIAETDLLDQVKLKR